MRMSVGVDLHKGQFTVCWRGEDGSVERSNRYPTKETGYGCFEAQLSHYMEKGYEVRVAVESTGNTRYFLRRMERVGVEVKLINTMKFKVVTESVKKTDRHDAATIRAFTDDISRFTTYKQYSAYAGLVPWVQSSNLSERYGNITKRGPKELRTALVQVVLGMVRNSRRTKSYRLMSRYAAMKEHKGSGKSIIATARKLSKIIWYMLQRNEEFDPLRMTDPTILKTALEMRIAVVTAA